jgi:hypothetical protein
MVGIAVVVCMILIEMEIVEAIKKVVKVTPNPYNPQN